MEGLVTGTKSLALIANCMLREHVQTRIAKSDFCELYYIPEETEDMSSTKIRECVKDGNMQEIERLTYPSVVKYLLENNLLPGKVNVNNVHTSQGSN